MQFPFKVGLDMLIINYTHFSENIYVGYEILIEVTYCEMYVSKMLCHSRSVFSIKHVTESIILNSPYDK